MELAELAMLLLGAPSAAQLASVWTDRDVDLGPSSSSSPFVGKLVGVFEVVGQRV